MAEGTRYASIHDTPKRPAVVRVHKYDVEYRMRHDDRDNKRYRGKISIKPESHKN